MNTPIADFVKTYANSNALRLHMPGHKGKSFLGFERFDITEINGADVLYSANGIIKQSEDNAARLFGSKKTLYSAEGSSLAIRAMLYLIKLYAGEIGKSPVIAAGRNAHKTFVTACALQDIDVQWMLPNGAETVISCDITPEYLESFLNSTAKPPAAVYITAPDYLGNELDVSGISKVCKKHGVLLAVDNAHGAYLKFLSPSRHPMDCGADICCDSAHKTLPVLTGGAYLHISENAPELFCEQAENALSLFASTSPSYLILQSLDMANRYLSEGYAKSLAEFQKEVGGLKQKLCAYGYTLSGSEPLKLTIAPKAFGYTGYELAKILSDNNIECEFSDPDFTVMMFTPETGSDALTYIYNVLASVQKREKITECPPRPAVKKKRMPLKDALFAVSEELPIENCLGRVMASAAVNCPPAIPIVICGEEIDSSAIECFKYYGIKSCRVVK